MNSTHKTRQALALGIVGAVGAMGLAFSLAPAAISKAPQAAKSQNPLPKTQAPKMKGREVATFGAGCFWSMEAMFAQLKGVDRAEPGYAGGFVPKPSYEAVCNGDTGHAEALQVVFDPKVITYPELLKVFFKVHDPTTLNRQGADVGTQYRSVVFFHSARQKEQALKAIREVNKSGDWSSPVVTPVEPFSNFYRAEDYHLGYFRLHPDQPYNRAVVAPKVEKFQATFKSKLKS